MKLRFDLQVMLVPLPEEQLPAWELAIQTLGARLADIIEEQRKQQEVADGQVEPAQHVSA
ncbi:MAG: hypothetical protein KF821_09150 [Anaerolineales bacterium]|nr:hypothetical protein [Anaerolineales bacterium]